MSISASQSTATQLLIEQLFQVSNKKISSPYYGFFVRGTHRWWINSPHSNAERAFMSWHLHASLLCNPETFISCIFMVLPVDVTNLRRVINSLALRRSECDSKNGIFNLVLLIGIFRFFHDNTTRWMPQDLSDDKSTLVQVMAWCRQATSHYLSQCWPRSLTPYVAIFF